MKVVLRDGNKSILFLTSYRLHMNEYTGSLRYYTFLSLSVRKTFTQVINVLLRFQSKLYVPCYYSCIESAGCN